MGQRLNIILVSEGAIDEKGQPITASDVQQVFTDWDSLSRSSKVLEILVSRNGKIVKHNDSI